MKNKTKIILCTVAIAGVVGVSGIFAYLTDKDQEKNKFTVGQVKIELQEPEWNKALTTDEDGDGIPEGDTDKNGIPDYAENLAPNATITKDPQVKNIGKNDAYIYLKVTVPAKNVITANSDGTKVNGGVAQPTQLFTYTPNEKWTEITEKKQTNTNASGDVESYTYVYYYNEVVAPNATTNTLFDSVTFANVIENEITLAENQTVDIDIDAYAIQANNLPEGTSIKDAYTIYLNQNN